MVEDIYKSCGKTMLFGNQRLLAGMTAFQRQMETVNHDLLPACGAGRQGRYSLLNMLLQ
jgi:hypothetical protein